LRRTRGNKGFNGESTPEKRKAILEALFRATEDRAALARSIDELDAENDGYYTLTSDEMDALISGNMEKIESWVSNLDKRHATWLLRWLIKESC